MSKRSYRLPLLTLLLTALLLSFSPAVWADGEKSALPVNPVSGTVVQISWLGEDLFAQLDLNGNGQGDAWAKIGPETKISDPQGTALSREAITVGVIITLTDYKQEHGYYEAKRIIVDGQNSGSGQGAATATIQGEVIQAFSFGDDLFVGLDTGGDGQSDTRVKVVHHAIIADPAGKRLAENAIQSGVKLTLISYKRDSEGYLRAFHVIVGLASTSGGGGLPPNAAISGSIIELRALGDDLFLWIDANGDGTPDFPVKLSPQTLIVDRQGRSRERGALQVGIKLSVSLFELKDGYYEAKRVIVG